MTSAAPVSRPLTHHDLEHTPDDGNLYEVIDGELYVSPFRGYAHQNAVGELFAILHAHVRARRIGRVLTAGLKVPSMRRSPLVPGRVGVERSGVEQTRVELACVGHAGGSREPREMARLSIEPFHSIHDSGPMFGLSIAGR
ncbi:MAG: Uma2 family endonuclease [Deltaproteobacteria bacterium]|nr:Uma2 family endonuclease [Deltaproteobacteria bacterium]